MSLLARGIAWVQGHRAVPAHLTTNHSTIKKGNKYKLKTVGTDGIKKDEVLGSVLLKTTNDGKLYLVDEAANSTKQGGVEVRNLPETEFVLANLNGNAKRFELNVNGHGTAFKVRNFQGKEIKLYSQSEVSDRAPSKNHPDGKIFIGAQDGNLYLVGGAANETIEYPRDTKVHQNRFMLGGRFMLGAEESTGKIAELDSAKTYPVFSGTGTSLGNQSVNWISERAPEKEHTDGAIYIGTDGHIRLKKGPDSNLPI